MDTPQNIQDFRKAKLFIDNMILFEMKMNRISSISFFNRLPEKPEETPVVEDSVHDDTDCEIPDENAVAVITDVVHEHALHPVIAELLKKHYEHLHFVWIQEGDKITVSWT